LERGRIKKEGLVPLLNAPRSYVSLIIRGETLRGGFAPSLLYSPLQPEITRVFYVTRAGEGPGVR
jgi:hypothetical protein